MVGGPKIKKILLNEFWPIDLPFNIFAPPPPFFDRYQPLNQLNPQGSFSPLAFSWRSAQPASNQAKPYSQKQGGD